MKDERDGLFGVWMGRDGVKMGKGKEKRVLWERRMVRVGFFLFWMDSDGVSHSSFLWKYLGNEWVRGALRTGFHLIWGRVRSSFHHRLIRF